MRAKIVCLAGDGIGPEVMQEAVRVLTSVACAFGHSFAFVEEKLGKSAIQAYGAPISPKTLEGTSSADAVLLGVNITPAPGNVSKSMRPEHGLSLLQKTLSLYAGIQYCPLPLIPAALSPLTEKLSQRLNVTLVWPLNKDTAPDGDEECPTEAPEPYAYHGEQAARLAFRLARQQRNSVCGVYPAEMQEEERFFMDAAARIAKEYPDVHFKLLPEDACAASLLKNPENFDVLLAARPVSRMFSGLLAGLSGGPGLCPCTYVGDGKPFIYLPAHGEEHHQAGRDLSNPVAMILSAAMMLRHSLRLYGEADCVDMAVKNVLDSGWRTVDLTDAGAPKVGTQAIGKLIAEQVDTVGAVMGAFRG